jgi:hydrogenase maturation protease
MNREAAMKVADAVLYEGYMLYPYRPSAIKNRQRWSFGILYSADYEEVRQGTERSQMHSECLLQLTGNAEVNVQLRFLHLLSKEAFELVDEHLEPVACITAGGEPMQTWDEGVARSVQFGTAINGNLHQAFNFDFPGTDESETLRDKDGRVVGELRRSQDPVQGTITLTCSSISAQLVKLSIDVANTTGLPPYAMDRDSALLSSLLSAHTILAATGGEFVSLLEPADDLRQYVSTCQNVGNFPVLVGTEGERDMMLCSPIVLYDYPQVAPESAGDFYDATEMDEMLTLRVMTLTDQEKNEMRMAGERVRNLLERTEASAREQLARTHGIIRNLRPASGE